MAKVGRPKSEDPKKERITVRFDTDTADRLKAYAEKMGMTKSEVVSEALRALIEMEKSQKQD